MPEVFRPLFQPGAIPGDFFDQRGCGKSTPSAGDDDATAALTDNTTSHLIDVLQLRRELKIHGKMHVFGGSWGSTLALAYAIAHPETVQTFGRDFRDEVLPRCREIQICAGHPHPERVQREIGGIALKDRGDVIRGLARILLSSRRMKPSASAS